MSCKRYEEFEDYCVDEEGNQVVLVNESNSPTSEPEVPEDHIEYDYVYENGQTYTNNKVPLQYQFIDAESNDAEHNSSGSKIIKAASSPMKISGRIRSNTSQTYHNSRVPIQYQFIDSESNDIDHNSFGSKNNKAASSSVKMSGRIRSNTSDWKEEEMKLLLKKHVEFARNVGKDKKFKSKKDMWAAITEEMNNALPVARTQSYYMTKFLHRFQTLSKRRKVGESFQSEIETLDSLHEDIMNDFDSARLNELEIHGEEITGPDSLMYQILPKTIIEVAKIKAHAQERRHREYIECVKTFEARYMENITKIIGNI